MSTSTSLPSPVELLDLDDLLEESTSLASARRAAKQGRKLTLEQAEILEANQLAEEMELWQPEAVYAHIVDTACSCGNHFQDFRGWYALEVRKNGRGQRLVRRDDHGDLPAMQYTTEAQVGWCHACASQELEQATILDCELLAELEGSPVYEACETEETPQPLEGASHGTST